jgi:DNA polymerase-3 subunit epsilon
VKQTVGELLAIAASLGKPPDIVGQAEVDQINIISRWIHRHSDDRAFSPFQPAPGDEQSIHHLAEQIWSGVDSARLMPPDTDGFDGMDDEL